MHISAQFKAGQSRSAFLFSCSSGYIAQHQISSGGHIQRLREVANAGKALGLGSEHLRARVEWMAIGGIGHYLN